MFKFIIICFVFVVVVSNALKIHDYYGHHHNGDEHVQYEHVDLSHHDVVPEHHEHNDETENHHEIEHQHATSHQSIKFHHYHPVPVYIKKDDQHLVKKPVEIGGTQQKLKVLHPKAEKNHNHGLVLEEYSESKFHHVGHPEEHDYNHHHHHE